MATYCKCDLLRNSGAMCNNCTEEAKGFLSIMPPPDHQHARFCDVVLVASDDDSIKTPSTPILAHKIVPASWSPIFKAMFENDMLENQNGIINISEVSYGVLRAFVNFLYTAKAQLDNQMAEDLLVLADRYQVEYLKTYCGKFLSDRLKWEKPFEVYDFAHVGLTPLKGYET